MPARIRKKAETINDAGPSATANSLPLHIQVRETIRRQVKDGELIDKTGRLMTEAELGRHFGVNISDNSNRDIARGRDLFALKPEELPLFGPVAG